MSIPGYEGTQSLAYLRGAWGTIGEGPWIEAIASVSRLQENSKRVLPSQATQLRIIPDSADTTTRIQQYVVSG